VHAESAFSEARKRGFFSPRRLRVQWCQARIGMMAAAASGVWPDVQVVKAGELESAEARLSSARTRNELLSQQLLISFAYLTLTMALLKCLTEFVPSPATAG
jgi:hypothetical protein